MNVWTQESRLSNISGILRSHDIGEVPWIGKKCLLETGSWWGVEKKSDNEHEGLRTKLQRRGNPDPRTLEKFTEWGQLRRSRMRSQEKNVPGKGWTLWWYHSSAYPSIRQYSRWWQLPISSQLQAAGRNWSSHFGLLVRPMCTYLMR